MNDKQLNYSNSPQEKASSNAEEFIAKVPNCLLSNNILKYLSPVDKLRFSSMGTKYHKAVSEIKYADDVVRGIRRMKEMWLSVYMIDLNPMIAESFLSPGGELGVTFINAQFEGIRLIFLNFIKSLAETYKALEYVFERQKFAQVLRSVLTLNSSKEYENNMKNVQLLTKDESNLKALLCLINLCLIHRYATNDLSKLLPTLASKIEQYTSNLLKTDTAWWKDPKGIMPYMDIIIDFKTQLDNKTQTNKIKCAQNLAKKLRAEYYVKLPLMHFGGLMLISLAACLVAIAMISIIAMLLAQTPTFLLVVTMTKIATFFKMTLDTFLVFSLLLSTILGLSAGLSGMLLLEKNNTEGEWESHFIKDIANAAENAENAETKLKPIN